MRDDDELMDQLLKNTLGGEAPRLSAGFDATVMARVKPRRLTPAGRLVLAGYGVAAAALSVWAMKDVPLAVVGISLLVTAGVAASLSAYGRAITRRAAGI